MFSTIYFSWSFLSLNWRIQKTSSGGGGGSSQRFTDDTVGSTNLPREAGVRISISKETYNHLCFPGWGVPDNIIG